MADDGDDLRLAEQICFAVYATGHVFNRVYKPVLDPLGLTYPQYLVLLILWEQDGLTVKGIGQRLSLDSGTLTPVLKRLETMGYVSRKRDAADERQVRVTLTRRGREIRAQVAAGRREILRALGWADEELLAIKRDLDQLRAALHRTADDAEVGAVGDVTAHGAGRQV